MYFGLMKKYKEQYGIKIFAYNLMPSHLHLLMEVDEKNKISTVMHSLNSSYTKYFNSRYKRGGHLFRERFKAALVEKDPKVLLNLTVYMHLNAKKLEIAAEAKTYPYSSYSLYLNYLQQNDHGLDIKNEINEILSGLMGENYADFMQKTEQVIDVKKMHKQLQRKGMLGSTAFIEEVKKQIELVKDQPEPQAEIPDTNIQRNKSINTAVMALLIVVVSAAGLYVYFDFSGKPEQVENPQVVMQENRLDNLDMTEWQLQLTPVDGGKVKSDIISFINGKVSSAYLAKFKYPITNYSMVREGNKIIWETMQTSSQGIASWRGEVDQGKMQGVLSLRQEGKEPQDFSFKSIKFSRK